MENLVCISLSFDTVRSTYGVHDIEYCVYAKTTITYKYIYSHRSFEVCLNVEQNLFSSYRELRIAAIYNKVVVARYLSFYEERPLSTAQDLSLSLL